MSRGIDRERRVRDWLVDQDDPWFVIRAAGSLGVADLVALRAGSRPLLIECKSTVKPFSHFGPDARERMRIAGRIAGADPVLVWWPKGGAMRWLHEREWPR